MIEHRWDTANPYGPICKVCGVALGTTFANEPCIGLLREVDVGVDQRIEVESDPEFMAMARILMAVREALGCDDMANPAAEVRRLKARLAELQQDVGERITVANVCRNELELVAGQRNEAVARVADLEAQLDAVTAELGKTKLAYGISKIHEQPQ